MNTVTKTITAKEFHAKHADILKAVRAGQSFRVTFHRQPIANVTPARKSVAVSKKPRPGSYEAVIESLKYTASAQNIPLDADLDALRWQDIQEKYGKYEK